MHMHNIAIVRTVYCENGELAIGGQVQYPVTLNTWEYCYTLLLHRVCKHPMEVYTYFRKCNLTFTGTNILSLLGNKVCE